MAKKKNKNKIGKYSLFAIVFFTIVTIVMAFLANIKYAPVLGDEFTVSGFEIMFGWKDQGQNITVEWSTFSFMGMLAYLLPIAGVITALLFSKSKLLSIVPLACFVAGAIFAFTIPSFIVLTDAGKLATALCESSLGFGAIIAGVMSVLSSIAMLAKILLS